MRKTYAEVEKRLEQAVIAMQTRKKPMRSKIAREFQVPVQKLQLQVEDKPPASMVRELHYRKFWQIKKKLCMIILFNLTIRVCLPV